MEVRKDDLQKKNMEKIMAVVTTKQARRQKTTYFQIRRNERNDDILAGKR